MSHWRFAMLNKEWYPPSPHSKTPHYVEQFVRNNAYVRKFMNATTNEARMKVTAEYYGRDNQYERRLQHVKDKTNFKDEKKSKEFLMKGTKAFEVGDFEKAQEFYTKAIAHAPLDSGELIAIGYANRSGVLYAMGRCRESLEDAQRAWSHNYCTNGPRLLSTEMKCHRDLGNMKEAKRCLRIAFFILQHYSELTDEEIAAEKQKLESELLAPSMKASNEKIIFPDKVPSLTYGPSSKIVGASSAVRMEWNQQLGRHLVANRDINIGDVLLIGENLVGAEAENHMHDHCSHCHMFCLNLLPCQNCALVMFCSEQCESEANKKYHDSECAAFSRFSHLHNNFNRYNLVIRLLATIGIDNIQPYLKYARANTEDNIFNSDEVFDSSNIESLFKLDCMIGKRNQHDMLYISKFSLLIPRCFGMTFDDPDFFAVAGLCLHLRDTASMTRFTKSYTNLNMDHDTIRNSFIYFNPLSSLKKHACHCNLYTLPVGNRRVSVAKWPISEGSVLTECYDYNLNESPKHVRQKKLKKILCYDCHCIFCENNWVFVQGLEIISDAEDASQIFKLLDFYVDVIWELVYRNLPPNLVSAMCEAFQKSSSDLLTKLHSKQEFRDHRCAEVSSYLFLYYALHGNRAVNPDSGITPYHVQISDCKRINGSVHP